MSYETAIDLLASRGVRHPAMSRVRTGASILQTPGAVNSELDQINDDVLAFGKEIADYVTALPGFPHRGDAADPKPEIETFYASAWSPFEQNWEAWYKTYRGWWSNFWWNHAPHAEEYLAQLIQLRARAEALGMIVHSPEPKKPPPGAVEGLLTLILSVLKTGLIVGLGFGAIALIVSWARK